MHAPQFPIDVLRLACDKLVLWLPPARPPQNIDRVSSSLLDNFALTDQEKKEMSSGMQKVRHAVLGSGMRY